MKYFTKKYGQYEFLFSELVKRDFNKRYKRSVLGILWSMLAPLFQLLVMSFVFKRVFGHSMAHFTIYLFAGQLMFNFFKEATNNGMSSIISNAGIITKVTVPKYLFLISKVMAASINFVLTLGIFFVFVALDRISFTWKFIMLIYPIGCLFILIIGTGLILSAMYVFFKDIQYLYDIFTLALMYFSAIFYDVSIFSGSRMEKLLYINPIFVYINYVRQIVLFDQIPSLTYHLYSLVYALVILRIGTWMYKKYNYMFLYYI
ncbi:ABC transporter permease [Clostridiaceae bacterium]|jgi:ABC-type polysaccharide/polyol phosphate export systems, permease component|nr:ABC transporter permease [Clostridiaceae bacterium]